MEAKTESNEKVRHEEQVQIVEHYVLVTQFEPKTIVEYFLFLTFEVILKIFLQVFKL